MTQVNGTQPARSELSLRSRATVRTLAQRRADFETQMRDMAIADLKQLAERLQLLNDRLNRQEGREVTQQEIAEGSGVKYRTYQTWVGAHRENRDGRGYAALARWYRRKLKDPTITRNWIVFGQEEPPEILAPAASPNGDGPLHAPELQEQLDEINRKLDELLRRTAPSEPAQPDTEPSEGGEIPTDLPDEQGSEPESPDEDEGSSEAAG